MTLTLSFDRIEELAGKPGVRGLAVSNFLSTLGGMTKHEAFENMRHDAKSYRWNEATVEAICTGIAESKETIDVVG